MPTGGFIISRDVKFDETINSTQSETKKSLSYSSFESDADDEITQIEEHAEKTETENFSGSNSSTYLYSPGPR